MKKIISLLILCGLLGTLHAAQPRSVTLIIQENGRAQISETHDVPPGGPDGILRIGPLPETLLPATVTTTPLERGANFDIISQRFLYDFRSDSTLFAAYRQNPITARKGTATWAGRLCAIPDFSQPSPALLLEADGQPIRLLPDIQALDAIEFPARADVARQPTLAWQLASGQTPPSTLQLHYAADGFAWAASHEAILAADSRSITLATRVHLSNQTQRDFSNARIRLALTEKGLYAPLVPALSDPRAARAPAYRYSADGKTWVPERVTAAAAVVATYDIPAALTLPAKSEVHATLAFTPAIPVETQYIYDGVRFDRFQRNRRTDANLGTESTTTIETHLRFKNNTPAPLPPGEFRLLRGQADQALEWIGTDWLPALKPSETTTLQLGPATGLTGRRTRTAFTDVVPLQSADESFEITLENQTTTDKTILVVEHFYRGEKHEITAASVKTTPGTAPNSMHFEIPVKANSSQTFTYTVRYTW